MEIVVTEKINVPVEKAWKVFVDEFNETDKWLSQVPKSYEKEDGSGRVCELKNDPNKLLASESIVSVDKDNYTFVFDNVPVNAPFFFPVNSNLVTILMKKISDSETEFTWKSEPQLNALGKILSPVMKKAITKGFASVVEEFKYYVENDEIHPRKLESNKKFSITTG